MYWIHSVLLGGVFFFLSASKVTAVELCEVEPPTQRLGLLSKWLLKRKTDYSVLDLKSSEVFLWQGSTPKKVKRKGPQMQGNFTVYMAGDNENILTMEKFSGLTKSIKCTQSQIDIQFKDSASYAYAKQVWDWVNGADNHSFAMVAGNAQCGWNKKRVPFNVTSIVYDDKQTTAHLNATASDWQTLAHTYDLTVGNVPDLPAKLRKRLDVSKDFSLGFKHAFPFSSFTFSEPGLDVEFECEDCGTAGSFSLSFQLSTEFFIPKSASASFSPRGVSASINPKVTFSTNITDQKQAEHEFPGIPLDGVSIPDLLNIGPQLIFSIGVEVGPVEGLASISSGVKVALKDSAVLTLGLLDSKSTFSGWTPTVSKEPLTVSAAISAEAKLSAGAAVALVATALGHGFEINLKLSPFVSAELAVTQSDAGACSTDKQKHILGVTAEPNIGVELTAEVSKEGGEETDPFLTVTLASVEEPLPSLCFGFGPKAAAKQTGKPGTTTVKRPTMTSNLSSTSGGNPTTAPASPSTCTNNAGASGTCISTSACSGQGGLSEAGHCPGAADIQCCTSESPASSPSTCNNDAGVSGTCISTSACASQGGVSEAGHCPGATDIQCCTSSSPASPPSCQNNAGTSGTCIATATCSAQGGSSEAGHCPGATDIQCCTTTSSASAPVCQNDAGTNGICIATATCSAQDGVSEAGHCPGAADIQCCTDSVTTASSCSNNAGVAGVCITTTGCAGRGGTSEAGHCTGPAEIQCCTGFQH